MDESDSDGVDITKPDPNNIKPKKRMKIRQAMFITGRW